MPRRNLGPDIYTTWLDQSQDYGQNYRRRSLFFTGRTIFSYHHGHILGVLHRRADGTRWVLLNGDPYILPGGNRSMTTGRHYMTLWRACHQRNIRTLTVSFHRLWDLRLPHTVQGPLDPEAVAATLVARQDHARVA